jgi:hypothetical protein
MAQALGELDGQALSSVELDGAETRFGFDLGCELETWPDNEVYGAELIEQWTLYQPSGER